ncbi:hypothetical protein N7522_003992 [Penicillium canescens]|nr:hypothetical protein N7522_003992 [Penicillium canescens]
MNARFVTSLFLRSFRGYHCLAETYRTGASCDISAELPRSSVPPQNPSLNEASEEMMLSLFQGYRPVFKPHQLGWEVESALLLSPSQRMCYYDGKLFGGYVAFLMDRILADCCKPAFTAYLNTSFLLPVPPTVPIVLRAWPEKVEGRKIFLKGSVQIPGTSSNEWLDAIKAEALFIQPKA